MRITKKRIISLVGTAGAITCIALFVAEPSYPTPDKLFVFLLFIFLALGQAVEMVKRLAPFVGLLLVYESFRGLIPQLNNHVNYTLAPRFDRAIFGKLPIDYLQKWLWRGHTQWYDVVFYIPYLVFFVLPIGLALLVWKTHDRHYWRVVSTYLLTAFAGFLTFLCFPAAPPWLASQHHVIEPITRISTNVWYSLGIHNFPSLYNNISPNPVAAIPSLHAAFATLFSLFVFKIYGRRWGLVSLIYPAMLYVGVVYEGEHYAFDVVMGVIYAVVMYLITPWLMAQSRSIYHKLNSPSAKKS